MIFGRNGREDIWRSVRSFLMNCWIGYLPFPSHSCFMHYQEYKEYWSVTLGDQLKKWRSSPDHDEDKDEDDDNDFDFYTLGGFDLLEYFNFRFVFPLSLSA